LVFLPVFADAVIQHIAARMRGSIMLADKTGR